jgi:hypothetical protein
MYYLRQICNNIGLLILYKEYLDMQLFNFRSKDKAVAGDWGQR